MLIGDIIKKYSALGIVTSGLIVNCKASTYNSGDTTWHNSAGSQVVNLIGTKDNSGTYFRFNKNNCASILGSFDASTLEIVGVMENIIDVAYFGFGTIANIGQGYTVIRTGNNLSNYPTLKTITEKASYNALHSLTSTHQNNYVEVYQNGAIAQSSNYESARSFTNGIWIGSRDVANNYIRVYAIRLYDRVLSASEILQNYNTDKALYGI